MPESKPHRAILALVAVQILFGINFVASKKIMDLMPPLNWATLRNSASAFLFIGYALLSRRPHPPVQNSFFRKIFLFSLFGITFNQSFFLMGLHRTTPINSAVITTLIPVVTLLLAILTRQESASKTRVAGFFFALLGVLSIHGWGGFDFSDKTWVGDFLTLLNCISYSLFLILSKSFMERSDPLWVTTWLFVFGTVGIAVASIPTWTEIRWEVFTPTIMGYMTFSIIGCTVFAYFLSMWALVHLHSSSVAFFVYLQPVFAALTSWIWLGEGPNQSAIIAILLIFSGMLMTLRKPMPVRGPE